MDLQSPDDIAVSVRNIGKRYHRYANMRDRLMHQFFPDRVPGGEEIWALQDISFDIRRGESVAIIGRNGGGKSTLLQILTGTLTPTQGDVQVNGRVCALLELGSGFNPEYSGRDNVMMNGLLLGLSRQQILDRFDDIADFAEIGDAIERPVKTYSSGMLLRLAFAVQVLADPDILIIDEALSVGDFFFQQKCLTHIRGLREKGVTLLFVSHDMGAVRDACERGIVLKTGRLEFDGPNLDAIRRYLNLDDVATTVGTAGERNQETNDFRPALTPVVSPLWEISTSADHTLEKAAHILAVGLYDTQGHATTAPAMGSTVTFKVHFKAAAADTYHIHIDVKNRSNQLITSTGSYNMDTKTPPAEKDSEFVFELEMQMSIEAGEYVFLASIVQPTSDGLSGITLDQTPWLGPVSVHWDYHNRRPPFHGIAGMNTNGRFVPL